MTAKFLEHNDDFSVATNEPVHSGKVRSVYWLKPEDSRRLIEQRQYPVAPDAELAVLIVDALRESDARHAGNENASRTGPGSGGEESLELLDPAGLNP